MQNLVALSIILMWFHQYSWESILLDLVKLTVWLRKLPENGVDEHLIESTTKYIYDLIFNKYRWNHSISFLKAFETACEKPKLSENPQCIVRNVWTWTLTYLLDTTLKYTKILISYFEPVGYGFPILILFTSNLT